MTWQQFEQVLEELGDRRNTQITYSQRTLEIGTSLPAHEVAKVLVGDLVKILLEEFRIDCESLDSTIFKQQDVERGVEPIIFSTLQIISR